MKKKLLLVSVPLLLSCLLLQNSFQVVAEDVPTPPSIPQNQAEERRYTTRLKVLTDGVENGAGGSLVAKDNKLSGGEGTTIELIPTANPGYRFVGYTSFRDDNGMSTDGLMPIENNRFDLSEKIGDVTVYAHFEAISLDESTYFSDDFSVWNPDMYTITGQNKALKLENSRLILSPSEMMTLTPKLGQEIAISETVGYQISLDLQQLAPIKPWNTMRIIFRKQVDDSYYALEVNGKKASIKKIRGMNAGIQDGDILGDSVQFELGGDLHQFVLTVTGNKVSIMDNGHPLLSYSSEDNFGESKPFVAFQMVSTGRTVSLDSFGVVKTQEKKKLKIVSRIDGVEDKAATAGIVSTSHNEVKVGDSLVIDVTEKYGYRFLAFKDATGNQIDLATYQIPASDTDELLIYAEFSKVSPAVTTVREYYVDSVSGSDTNDGSETDPYKTLKALHMKTLAPGDRILLKAGSVYNGLDAALMFKGSGLQEKPIYIGMYGEGAKPVLNGEGKVENLISLFNQEYITIENLELTNLSPEFSTSFELNGNDNKTKALRAINVSAKNFGIVHNITLRNLYIHDVNGKLNMKWNGGIFFDVKADLAGGELTGTPTKYDGILIENNLLERVDRSAMKLVSSDWSNQSAKNNPNRPLNWYPSTNVIVRNNRIDKTGGDAITVRDTDGALVEYNKVSDSRYQNTGYNAGIWPFQATNTVIQYNEVYRTRGVQDGQGLDNDHVSSNTVMQYNYSHDNEGGFMLVMNGFPHVSPTIRYNISQNDKDKAIEFARGTPAGVVFYNNTLYSEGKLTGRAGIIDMSNTKAGTGNRDAFFFNNIFYYPYNESFFVERSDAGQNIDKFHFYNNAYWGVTPPVQEKQAITGIAALTGVPAIPEETDSFSPRAGRYLGPELDRYRLDSEDINLIKSGVSLQEAIDYFYKELHITNQQPISEEQRLRMSPTELFDLANSVTSVDAIAQTYPPIATVTYTTDFFGTTLPASNLSLGAAQYRDGAVEEEDIAPIPAGTIGDERDKKTGEGAIGKQAGSNFGRDKGRRKGNKNLDFFSPIQTKSVSHLQQVKRQKILPLTGTQASLLPFSIGSFSVLFATFTLARQREKVKSRN